MKILKLSSYYYPERISSSHLTNDLENAYKDAGFETVVYAPTPCRGISDQTREKYKKIKYEQRLGGNIEVYRFPMYKEGKNPILRAIRYSLVQWVQYRKAIKTDDIDVLSSGSTPPTQGILMARVKKRLSKRYKKNVSFVYNLQDVFPDSLVTAGLTKKDSFLWKIGRKIEDYTYKNADAIIVISEDIKNNIIKKGVDKNKIRVISNWINTQNVKHIPRDNNALAQELGIDMQRFTVVYAGNLGLLQSVETLIQSAELLKDQPIDFLIFGKGAMEQKLKEQAEHLDNVKFFPLQPAERISEVYSLGNICAVLCKSGAGGSAIPSKTWSIMACESPILASFDTDSDLVRMLDKTQSGISVNPEQAKELADVILYCYNNKDMLEQMGKNGREYVEKNLSSEICTQKYVNLFKEVTNKI